jgi:hypothetical protein
VTATIRSFSIVALMFLLLSFMAAEASALSVEMRGGYDRNATYCSDPYEWCPDDSGTNVGLNILFSQSKSADLFIGAEYARSNTFEYSSSYYNQHSKLHAFPFTIDYSFDYTALSFGAHFKMIVHDRWHLYMAMGGLVGTSSYKASVREQINSVSLYSDRGRFQFATLRMGPGAIFNITEQLGMGMELAVTGPITTYELKIREVSPLGNVRERNIKGPESSMLRISLGLRYTF